jgi:hypothetical protein
MVIYIVTTLTFVNLGFEHNLYNYGGVTEVPTPTSTAWASSGSGPGGSGSTGAPSRWGWWC